MHHNSIGTLPGNDTGNGVARHHRTSCTNTHYNLYEKMACSVCPPSPWKKDGGKRDVSHSAGCGGGSSGDERTAERFWRRARRKRKDNEKIRNLHEYAKNTFSENSTLARNTPIQMFYPLTLINRKRNLPKRRKWCAFRHKIPSLT